jgi:O-antigen ligase
LNDRYRGLGTGFTGRVGAWEEALDLFRENPVFGVGFRMHERYMTAASSAHNGYLSLLAETGAVGALLFLVFTGYLLWRLFRRAAAGEPIAVVGFSFVTGYLFIAAFERLFLNMGNPTSVLAWMFLMLPPARRSFRVWEESLAANPFVRAGIRSGSPLDASQVL